LGNLPGRLNELDKEDVHLMVCRIGVRSGNATFLLQSQGFKAINLEGGMISWAALKYPIEKN
jgi:rhodanese-related sulfurtransferase